MKLMDRIQRDDKSIPDPIRAFFGGWGHVTVNVVEDPDPEMVNMLHKIKQHKEPPWHDDDIYWMREPWQKFGGVSSGICMKWCWFRDDVILKRATREDMLLAIKDINETTGVNK